MPCQPPPSFHTAALLLPLLLLWMTGCREQKEAMVPTGHPFPGTDATDVVARVDGQPILRSTFQQALSQRGPEADKEALLDELITFEATYAKAKVAGSDQKPEVQAALKRLIVSNYQEEQLGANAQSAHVIDEEINRYYQEHLADYGTPEKVRAALLFVSVPSRAAPEKQAEYAAQADAILAEARQLPPAPPTFGALAAKYSEDQSSRYQGGDIGWVIKGQQDFRWGQQVLDALFALDKPGELSPVIRTSEGLVMVLVMDHKPASTRPLSELKDGIAYRLSRAKAARRQQDFWAAMKAGLPIDINRPLLETITPPAVETRPPGLPGSSQARASTRR